LASKQDNTAGGDQGAENLVPQDPSGGAPVIDARIDGLEGRIAFLESEKVYADLSAEDKYRKLLRHEVMQRIGMRYAAIVIALAVISTMVWFARHVLFLYFVGPFVAVPPAVAIALFVAPIVSVSAITIMLLIGAFRRFKDDDLDQINAQAVVEAGKAAAGMQ
jgi:hypothetical protein